MDRWAIASSWAAPEKCADATRPGPAATGATEMTFRLRWPGMDHASAVRSRRLLGEHVRPLMGS